MEDAGGTERNRERNGAEQGEGARETREGGSRDGVESEREKGWFGGPLVRSARSASRAVAATATSLSCTTLAAVAASPSRAPGHREEPSTRGTWTSSFWKLVPWSSSRPVVDSNPSGAVDRRRRRGVKARHERVSLRVTSSRLKRSSPPLPFRRSFPSLSPALSVNFRSRSTMTR